ASVLMALALTACQKEEFGGNEAEGIYTFEVSADNIATKAAIDRDGNGTAVNRFIMEVYLAKTTGELVLLDRQVKAPTAASPKSTSFNLTLIKDQEYKVLFWADKGDDSMEDLYYKTTDNLQNVSFLDEARKGNNDALDAFSKMEVITREESKAGFSKSVQLTRPFGQVNFITTDIPAIRALSGGSDFLPTDVRVSYTTCTGFNVLTQTGTGSEAIEYTAPVYSAMAPATNPAKYTLSMDYMLTATSDRETRNLVKLTALANGYELTTVEVANYPVQRNYRTNIIGKILTGDVTFNITIDPIYDGEYNNYLASSNEDITNAISAGVTTISLTPGTYIIPDDAKGKTLTFIGTGNPEDTKIATQDDGSYEGCDYSLDGATVTFENITINTDSENYTGYARCKGTYKNCVINGTYTLYGDSKFENCTFNVSGDVYNIWTWGAQNAEFDSCTFNSDGKALLLYQEGTNTINLTVNRCIFNDNGGLTAKKAAIEIGDAPYGKTPTYNVTVSGTTVNGYEINDEGINTGTTLWGNKNSMPADRLNVTVDGVNVY
ncbi:MAG: DUF6562 domain-containing protein, partial [Candidatus Cryptobacteroides sp.]|nr:DUF6562 domain-containing protein [Candidatus Cryptobacteroides sp.]